MAVQTSKKGWEATKVASKDTGRTVVADTACQRKVEEAAYYLAEKRGFQPGHELQDWLTAERQVTMQVKRSSK